MTARYSSLDPQADAPVVGFHTVMTGSRDTKLRRLKELDDQMQRIQSEKASILGVLGVDAPALLAQIFAAVERHMGVGREKIVSPSRLDPVVKARDAVIGILADVGGFPDSVTGPLVGRQRSVCSFARRSLANLLDVDRRYKAQYNAIREEVGLARVP